MRTPNSQNIDKSEFARGFVSCMRDIQNATEGASGGDGWHREGYRAAHNHFYGAASNSVRLAERLGLVALYDGFYGQSDFAHPEF